MLISRWRDDCLMGISQTDYWVTDNSCNSANIIVWNQSKKILTSPLLRVVVAEQWRSGQEDKVSTDEAIPGHSQEVNNRSSAHQYG